VAHRATIATARPVHYDVCFNKSSLSREQIEELTYHLAHSYFNYIGSIKVPASCMYAHKLANYLIENEIQHANDSLSLLLHYL
jgi:aubergine-like protein